MALTGACALAGSPLMAQDGSSANDAANNLLCLPPGPYSSGVGNATSPAPDDPIPGFVNGQVNPKILGWAAQVKDYSPANPAAIDSFWMNTGNLLQPVTGNVFDVVSLGDLSAADIAKGVAPGSLTLSFVQPVGDSDGPDLVIFGNAFQLARSTKVFAKLAFVEVSTDGVVFARFPSVDSNPRPTGTGWPYVVSDATKIYNLFGKAVNAYGSSWGNPFDLRDLTNHPLVLSGAVDLQNIRYVRLVAIPGSGAYQDSLGHPIYCPWPTYGSPGPEVQAVGILHVGHPVADDAQTSNALGRDGAGGAGSAAGVSRTIAAQSRPKVSTKAITPLAGGAVFTAMSSGPTLDSDIATNAQIQTAFAGNGLPPPESSQSADAAVMGTGTVAARESASAPPSAISAPFGPGVTVPSASFPDQSLAPTGLPVPAGTPGPGGWGRAVQRIAYLTGWAPTPSAVFFILIFIGVAFFSTLRLRRAGRKTGGRGQS